MIFLSREQCYKEWNRFWDEAQIEFFKVEDVQDYSGEDTQQDGSLQLWMKGDKEAALDLIRTNRNEWAEQTSAKPITKIRIHVVDEPYCEYLKWEIEHYKLVNIPLGKERTFLVNREDVPDYNLGDFMLFDGTRVTKSHYSAVGRLEGMDIYENEPIDEFLAARELLMKYAVEIIV